MGSPRSFVQCFVACGTWEERTIGDDGDVISDGAPVIGYQQKGQSIGQSSEFFRSNEAHDKAKHLLQ